MLVPVSWLKDYVDIKIPIKKLASKLTEVGLGCEEIIENESDTILNLEITANRPDCLSIIGIAREICALENKEIKIPKLPIIKKPKKTSSINIKNNYNLCPIYSAIIINDVKLKNSPQLIQERLIKAGLRPINNLVDITNYVMLETGNPIHVFDYDEIKNHKMEISLSKGGESFKSVDKISYVLPKNSIIFKDQDRVIDLCGIKGGENSGINEKTKNILILVAIYNGNYIRKTSQSLSLRSEASSIFERGANYGGTENTLKRAVYFYQELTGGQIGSEILSDSSTIYKPWEITVPGKKVSKILGIEINKNEIISILNKLNLKSSFDKKENIISTIPTYRNDLKIEEDIIEEIARHYGYNNFPKTMPQITIPSEKIAYYKNYNIDFSIKETLKENNYSEIYTYSLVSASEILKINEIPEKILKVANPVSLDFQFLRPTLLINLLKAVAQNQPNFDQINLFELGKVYSGENLNNYSEKTEICTVTNEKKGFEKIMGLLDSLSEKLNSDIKFTQENENGKYFNEFKSGNLTIKNDIIGHLGQIKPALRNNFMIKNDIYALIIDYQKMINHFSNKKNYVPIPKYPAVKEELTLTIVKNITYAQITEIIKNTHHYINNIEYLGIYQNFISIRIFYQSKEKTLSKEDVALIRNKIIDNLYKIGISTKSK